MPSLGIPEILVILVVALVFLGPRRLPHAARKLGEAVKQLKEQSESVKKEFSEIAEVEEFTRQVSSIRQDFKDAVDVRSVVGGATAGVATSRPAEPADPAEMDENGDADAAAVDPETSVSTRESRREPHGGETAPRGSGVSDPSGASAGTVSRRIPGLDADHSAPQDAATTTGDNGSSDAQETSSGDRGDDAENVSRRLPPGLLEAARGADGEDGAAR